jgi:uncharacterized protein
MSQDFNDPTPPPPEPTHRDIYAFVMAARDNDLATVERYLAMFSTRIINAKNGDGTTALMRAAAYEYHAVVALLLENGANVEARDSTGDTALLICAARGGDPAIAALLLEKGADIETKNNDGHTALMLAAAYGRPAITALLLERGANIDTKDHAGNTARMWAARNDRHDDRRAVTAMINDAEEERREKDRRRREAEEVVAEVHNGITEEIAVESLRFRKKGPDAP